MPPFSFLTNHGLALLCIAEDPRARMRDIAATIGITERAAQRIVSDLVGAGYLDRARDGRRNSYTVRLDLQVQLPNQRDVDLGALMKVLAPASTTSSPSSVPIRPSRADAVAVGVSAVRPAAGVSSS